MTGQMRRGEGERLLTGASTTETSARGGGNQSRHDRRHQRHQRTATGEPFTLPQWSVDLFVRPVLHTFFKVAWRLDLCGLENIPPPADGGLIIAANHQTYIDPFWISAPIKRPLRYLAWSEAFNWPVVGPAISLLGAWPLQIEGRDPSGVRRAIQYLREGGAVMIFPEGGRCEESGTMADFKCGAARMALEAGVPILPVTIRGGERVWPRGWRWPRLGRVQIIFHPLQKPAQHPDEDVRHAARRENAALIEKIKSAV
jgi:1-acyl-sn-glycerol-3-phosphate acyltransferase